MIPFKSYIDPGAENPVATPFAIKVPKSFLLSLKRGAFEHLCPSDPTV